MTYAMKMQDERRAGREEGIEDAANMLVKNGFAQTISEARRMLREQ